MEKGFTIKFTEDNLSVDIIGTLTFDEALELSLLAMKSFLDHTKEVMLAAPNPDISEEEADQTVRAVLYDKAVIAFSFIMDSFFPEAKELKAKADGFEEYIRTQTELNKKELQELKKLKELKEYNETIGASKCEEV